MSFSNLISIIQTQTSSNYYILASTQEDELQSLAFWVWSISLNTMCSNSIHFDADDKSYLVFHCVCFCVLLFKNSFTCWWALWLISYVLLWLVLQSTGWCKYVWYNNSVFSESEGSIWITWFYDKTIFSFIGTLCIVFHSSCTNLHFHQNTWVLLFNFFL